MMSFFIKYPPDGDDILKKPDPNWQPCTIGTEPEYGRAGIHIEMCEDQFKETSNLLYAIEALRIATEAKLYPPLWVIDVINSRFQYAAKNGFSLDRAFGFSHEGLGRGKRTSPSEAIALTKRNYGVCVSVFKLEAVGLSRSAACDALSSLWVDGRGNEVLSGSAIRKIVSEVEHKYQKLKKKVEESSRSWTKEEKRMVLSNINPNVLPKKLRKLLY